MDRLSGCTGKIPYFTQGEARSAIKRFKHNDGRSVYVYHCKYLLEGIEHWHLTSMARKKYKQIKRRKNYGKN